MSLFEQYIQTALGWHDGVRIRVLDNVESPLVSVHEAVHERIFTETPDGQVHAAFAAALRQNLVSDEDKSAVTETVAMMFGGSRNAHEVFANYLSIKVLPAAAEVQYLSELSPTYRGYYDQLAALVDENIPTSYLQYLIGWEFAVVVFSSNMIERAAQLQKGTSLILEPDERPNDRLVLLLETLEEQQFPQVLDRIRATAEQECEREGIEQWNFFSEEAWTQRTLIECKYSDGNKVEEALSSNLRTWLRDIVPLHQLPVERQAVAFDGFSEMVLERFGMKLHDTHGLLGLETIATSTMRSAVSQSRSRVVNTKPIQLPRGEVASLEDYENWCNYGWVGVYSACPPQNTNTWMVLFWTDDPNNHGAAACFTFESQEVEIFLELWSQRREAGYRVPQITGVVLAIRGLSEYPEVLQAHPFLLAEGIREKLCWYLWNGIFETIHAFLSEGQPLYFGRVEMQEYARHHGQPSQLEYDGMVIAIVQTTEEPLLGIFVRAMRYQAFAPLNTVITAAVREHKAHWITDEALRELVPLGRETLAVAETFWEEY